MAQQKTTKQLQGVQGQSHKGTHKQKVQLCGAAELKKWDKEIGPRSVAAAERCRKPPEFKKQEWT
jgi:hypothetical protein